MSEVVTSKRIDLPLLSQEVGASLSGTSIDDVSTITGDVPQADLEAAIAAHNPPDYQANRSTLEARAVTAMQGNRDFLSLSSPSNAQVLAQVRALSRQNNGIIRLILGRLDGTD